MAKPALAKDVCRMLREAGFEKVRGCASHSVYQNRDVKISVPDGHKTISPGLMRKINNAVDKSRIA